MKALKEKRVSLRSLFRRSLVILSILALAFAVAACSDSSGGNGDTNGSSGGGGTDTSNPGGGGTTLPDLEWVSNMQVLKHPNKPSYEGARPDLSGLEVMVTWKKGDTITKQVVEKSDAFEVYPPVAFVNVAGTHVTEFSRRGDYRIQYKSDKYYDLGAYTENVYIPGVIALDPGFYDTTDPLFVAGNEPATTGSLGDVYEDQPFDASGVKYEAVYVAFGATDHDGTTLAKGSLLPNYSNGVPPDSYYRALTEITWPTIAGTAKERTKANGVSSNIEAWRIPRRPGLDVGTTTKPVYLASLGGPYPSVRELYLNKEADVGTFYYVDRFNYLEGNNAINGGKILADDAKLSPLASDNSTHIATRENWLAALLAAGEKLKFEVIYFNLDKTKTAKRTITINEYVKALYTPRADYETVSGVQENWLRPRATLPRLTGGANATPARGVTGVQESVIYGYEDAVYVQLFYYNPYIRGTVGKGIIEDNDIASGYETANMALIPISELIWIYNSVTAERIDSTDHGNMAPGGPEVWVNAGGAISTFTANAATIYQQLQTYWDIYWWYENPNDPTAPLEKVPYVPTAVAGTYYTARLTGQAGRGASGINATWPAYAGNTGSVNASGIPTSTVNNQLFLEGGTTGAMAIKEGDFVYDNSSADEDEERTCTVTVLEPLSAATVQAGTGNLIQGTDEVEMPYIMKP